MQTEIKPSIHTQEFNNVSQDPITALPIYDIHQTPTNYSVNLKATDTKNIRKDCENNVTQFYVDGSCVPNPEKGAYGWYSPNYNYYKNVHKTYNHDYPVTTANCEIMAIITTG